MEEIAQMLKKIALAIVGSGAAFLSFYMALFCFVMFLVPTSSPSQAKDTHFLSQQRSIAVALGVSTTVPLAAIAWFSFRALMQQK